MHTSRVTSKGQVTIPAEIRKALKLAPGKRVAFRLGEGQVTLEPVRDDITAAFGLLKAERHVGLDEMERVVEEAAAGRFDDSVADREG